MSASGPTLGDSSHTVLPVNPDETAIFTPPAGTPTLNADNPWPGLLAFREADQDYFEGRHAETEELFRLVMRDQLTVFFGLSGLGKSSLLQAGLFPLLRRDLPVYIRLDFSSANLDLIAQVKFAIAKQAELAQIEAPALDPKESLWESFHRQESDFWTRRNRPVMPLIIFDQFEEVFTLGRLDAQRIQATENVLEQLADLAEGRAPAALKDWLDEHPDNVRNFSFTRHHYKVLLSIREDFLPELEALRERMPSIALNRLRLQRMNGTAALRVVARAEHLIELPVAESVVRFVAADRDVSPLDGLEVEPALLSVVCRELNNRRQELREPKITESLLEGSHDQILNDFYERTLSDLPISVRNFIEEHLLTVSGFRNIVALEDALNVPGVTGDCINQLVERRLLRRDDRGGVQRLELTHDLLTGVVRASRDRRRQEEALIREQERQRRLQESELEIERKKDQEEWTRRKIEQLKLTRRLMVIFALLTIAAIAGLVGANSSPRRCTSYQERAGGTSTSRSTNHNRTRSGQPDSAKPLDPPSGVVRGSGELNELLSKLGQNDKIQFGAKATDLHYRNRDGEEVYQFELYPRQETLPSGKDAVAFITYLANHPSFQNNLLTAGQNREFRATYQGWGCLTRIVALTEYADPAMSHRDRL